MLDRCYITLCDPKDHTKTLVLEFELLPTEIASKWKQAVLKANLNNIRIDDPCRFYGLVDKQQDIANSIAHLNNLCNTINEHEHIIHRQFTDINDQDTLNYLHHIFEVYHGLLDQQNHKFWLNAPEKVRNALANLNVQIHKIESLQRKNLPRFVVTYFKLAKTEKLTYNDFQSMTNHWQFGGLYLNYVEIGKTLENLMKDNDNYIHDDAFKPWNFYSADFKVMLSDVSLNDALLEQQKCLDYFRQKRDFFEAHGFMESDIRLKPGAIQIGQMLYRDQNILEEIAKNQYVLSVDFDNQN